ncbi:MAG: DEAD/DEAH box helicase [Planctomycetota bacterium]
MSSDHATTLSISPAGHVFIDKAFLSGSGEGLGGRVGARVQKAFDAGVGEGLLHLASRELKTDLPSGLAFGRRIAAAYLTALSKLATLDDMESSPAEAAIAGTLAAVPPMRGGEYASPQTLLHAWQLMTACVVAEMKAFDGALHEYLQQRNPAWHGVGRVTFHLAEQKNNALLPFAFLATFGEDVSESGRIRHVPLGRAIEGAKGDRKTLLQLLRPVSTAGARNAFVQKLIDSGDIHHPIAWSEEDAYQFLLAVPDCEASGVVVRVPDWWQKKSRRASVGTTIGSSPASVVGLSGLLDFDLSVHVDGMKLSKKEREELLSGSPGLRMIRGNWVEVDPGKLSEALAQLDAISQVAGSEGLTFAEGMRLLAGVPTGKGDTEVDATVNEWARIEAGPWLAQLLEEICDPKQRRACDPGAALLGTLRPYQADGVAWLYLLQRLGLGACLADDMGLGKTIQVLALFCALAKEKSADAPPHLLVVPASLLGNWKAEASRFTPSLKLEVLHRSELSARELREPNSALLKGADIVMTTYATLSRLEWLRERDWSVIVLDEAQAIKNSGTRQTKNAKSLKGRMRIALTGTPVENRLGDLWSIFDFLNPGLLGSAKKFTGYAKKMASGDGQGLASLRRLIDPYILRRLKTDKSIAPELPEKTEVDVYCGLSKAQSALYAQGVEELKEIIENLDGIARRGAVLSFLMRFKQICNHPSQWNGDGVYDPKQSGKFLRLAELCEPIVARQEKLILFTQFRETIEPLLRHLSAIFGREGISLHGQTPIRRRQELVDQFQRADGPPFFVLSLRAGGTGLNLTQATHVVHFDRWWNPAVENQATDRAFRIGQTRGVLVHRFICRGTIEEKIDAMIRAKRDMADEILSGGAETAITEMGADELIELVSLDLDRVSV